MLFRSPNRIYGIHATDHMFLVSSPRKFRGIPYTLLCGFFVDSAKVPSRREVMRLVDAACVMWSHPLYVHIGLCHTIAALPGFALPHQLRPSPMLVQLRDFHSEKALMNFDHYQLLDFDFG